MNAKKFEKKPLGIVGIISKHNISHNKKFVLELVEYLKKHRKKIVLDENVCKFFPGEPGLSREHLLREVDLAIVLGGDGTLLKTARCIGKRKNLVLGVNLGTVGFLTETTAQKTFENLDKIFKNQYHVDRRSLLRTTVYRDGVKVATFLALNDAVINQGAFARLIKMSLEINNRKVVSVQADGLIVSTPTGSTAHSLAAGGPILHPKIEALVITPICPRSLAMRPIIVPDTRQLTAVIETDRSEEQLNIGLTLDGQDTLNLEYGDVIKFRRSKRSLYMVRTGNRYYRMLRTKLKWGEA